MNIAIIPARGGSKRIPRKNIKAFCGKPMIAWSIEAAQESDCFDRIIVSTDDEEIAEISRNYGVEAPFVRPTELSDDHTSTNPVIAHAIQWQKKNGEEPTAVCCVYATAPFLCGEDLRKGLEILEGTRCDYVFSVTSYAFPIQRAVRITDCNRIEMFNPHYFNNCPQTFQDTRSQDLEESYHDAGQFYWGLADSWLSGKSFYTPDSAPIILPRWRVQDIDNFEDWHNAERIMNTLKKQNVEKI